MATLATKAPSPQIPSDCLSRLPKEVLKEILRFLLVSTKSVILEVDEERPFDYSTGLDPTILRSCHYIYSVGIEVLYSCNTFTTSSAATSVDFDKHLLSLPGRTLQLIRHVKLEIDWGVELWTKLPLIASALGSIQSLKTLKISVITKSPKPMTGVVRGKASGSETFRGGGFPHRLMAVANAEKRVFKDFVLELQALKVFRLRGSGTNNLPRIWRSGLHTGAGWSFRRKAGS